MGQHPQVLEQPRPDLIHVLCGVLVRHVGGGDVELEVGPEELEVVVVGQLVRDVDVESNGSFVGPAAGDVADGVAAATEQHQRQLVTKINIIQ